MGIVEEGGKVAGSVVEGLKTNPSCLAAIAILAIVTTMQYFADERADARQTRRFDAVVSLLNRCYPDEGRP
jgi:hypothetical protein